MQTNSRVRLMAWLMASALAGGVSTLSTGAAAQNPASPDAAAVRTYRSARSMALQGQRDEALAGFLRAADEAKRGDDKAIMIASMRGAADLMAMQRPCTERAETTLRAAVAAADPGDRSAADALVRLLASRGNANGARTVLVAAYSDVPSLGRAITKESMRYLQGLAAVEFAGGHESATLGALQQSLAIAARLHHGDVGDTIARPSGVVDAVNAWVLYDIAQLRLTAKSAAVRNLRMGASIMDLLLATPTALLDGGDDESYPVTRIGDRLAILGHARGATSGAVIRGC